MEYLDIVDDKGNPTGDIVSRDEAHDKGIRHRTAHVWIIFGYMFCDILGIIPKSTSFFNDFS